MSIRARLSKTSIKSLLLSTSVLIAVGAAGAARAQATGDTSSPPSVGELVVTGTRLKLPDYSAPNPVTTIDSQTIEDRGVTNITDFLRTIPLWKIR